MKKKKKKMKYNSQKINLLNNQKKFNFTINIWVKR